MHDLRFQVDITLIILVGVCIPVTTAVIASHNANNLTCYDCSENFKVIWIPGTPCESNLTVVPLAICHSMDKYCKVERTSVKGMTTSVTRGCAEECSYGCRVLGFGVTQLKCTSCCSKPGCNNGNKAESAHVCDAIHRVLLGLCTYLTLNLLRQL